MALAPRPSLPYLDVGTVSRPVVKVVSAVATERLVKALRGLERKVA